jgi:hypothetical protein
VKTWVNITHLEARQKYFKDLQKQWLKQQMREKLEKKAQE